MNNYNKVSKKNLAAKIALLGAGAAALCGTLYQLTGENKQESKFESFNELFVKEAEDSEYAKSWNRFVDSAEITDLVSRLDNLNAGDLMELADWKAAEDAIVKKITDNAVMLREMASSDIDSGYIAETFFYVRKMKPQFDELGLNFSDMISTLEMNCNKLLLVTQDMAALGMSMNTRAMDAKDNYEGFFEELEECETAEEKLEVTDLLKDYYKGLLSMLRLQHTDIVKAHSIFAGIQTKMVEDKSRVLNMQGEAETLVQRKFDVLSGEKKVLLGKMEAYNDHMVGWEKFKVDMGQFEQPEDTLLAYNCENKNKNCMTLTDSFSESEYTKSSKSGGGSFLGIGGHSAKSSESGKSVSESHDKLECWKKDECTKILADHYAQEKKQVHELKIKSMEMKLAWEKENRKDKKEFLEARLNDMIKIKESEADLLRKDGEISRWNWVMINQTQYLDQLVRIMKDINKTTGDSTGNMNDIMTKTRDAIDILDSKKDSNRTFKLLKSGKIGTNNKKVVEQLITIAMTGRDLRKLSLHSEKEYGKIVYLIVNPKATKTPDGAPIPADQQADSPAAAAEKEAQTADPFADDPTMNPFDDGFLF